MDKHWKITRTKPDFKRVLLFATTPEKIIAAHLAVGISASLTLIQRRNRNARGGGTWKKIMGKQWQLCYANLFCNPLLCAFHEGNREEGFEPSALILPCKLVISPS